MEQSDIVNMMDKKYSGDGRVVCPNEGVQAKMQCGQVRSEHGAMGVHSSAAYLVCGVCGSTYPTSRI